MEITCPTGLKGRIVKPKVRVMNEMRKIANQDQVRSFTYLLSQCWAQTLEKGPYRWEDEEGIPWDEVLSGDRFYLLLQLRKILHGQDYKFSLRCSQCTAHISWVVNLDDLEVKKLPDSARAALTREDHLLEGKLSDGTEFKYRLTTGRTERAVSQGEEEPLLKSVMPRLFLFGEQAQPAKIREMLLDLDADLFDELRAVLLENDCGVETRIEVYCERCRNYSTIDLPFDQRFFFPRSGG